MTRILLTAEQFDLFDIYLKQSDFLVPENLPASWELTAWNVILCPYGWGGWPELKSKNILLSLPGVDPSLHQCTIEGPVRFIFRDVVKFDLNMSLFDPATTNEMRCSEWRYLKYSDGKEISWNYHLAVDLEGLNSVDREFDLVSRWPQGSACVNLSASPTVEMLINEPNNE